MRTGSTARVRHGVNAALVSAASLAAVVVSPIGIRAQAVVERVQSDPGAGLRGSVSADGVPVRHGSVFLVHAGNAPGTARVVRATTTDALGAFSFGVPRGIASSDVLYVTVRNGSIGKRRLAPKVELAAALADQHSGAIVVNELTTVAAGYSLAQFASRGSLGGADPGLRNAAMMSRNLVDLATGQASRFFSEYPNGNATETLASFNSLASIIAGCAAGTNDCDAFLRAATDAWGTRPRTTWQAVTLLPRNPSGDPQGVFAQLPMNPRFTPVRTSAPAAWTLVLRFYGNGQQFNGPGNVAFDEQGRVWSDNNAEWSLDPEGVCPGLEVFRLDPYMPGQPVEAFAGGGVNGAGFGTAFDAKGHLWVTNFGFTGDQCTGPPPTENSVSEFDENGAPLSPASGYLDGPLHFPQGVKSDVAGNIWIASCGTNALVIYPGGRHEQGQVVGTGIDNAFDVAQNAAGSIYVTANAGDQVFGFDSNGDPLPGSPFGDARTLQRPLGAASDSLGNVWIANSGVVNVPCSDGETLEPPAPGAVLNGSMALLGIEGTVSRFTGAGLTVPWGIAVDGDDNVWVANFSGQRLAHLCGARPSTCPSGTVGAAISPSDTGYSFNGLQRNTGVQVDASGNVWLANNWKNDAFPADPYGDGLVAYLGVAAPVRMPLIGTPQHP